MRVQCCVRLALQYCSVVCLATLMMDTRQAGGGAGMLARAQTTWSTRRNRSTQQSSVNTGQTERDPLLYNMFEVLISSLDDKFRRVDTIERAVHMIMRHMEIMDMRLQKSNNLSAAVFHRLDSLERRLAHCISSRQYPAAGTSGEAISARSLNSAATAAAPASTGGLQRQLASVEAHVSRLQRTLDGLEVSIVSADLPVSLASSAHPLLNTRKTTTSATTTTTTAKTATSHVKRASRYRVRETHDAVQQNFIKGAEKMVDTVDELRGKVVAMDDKLSYHMNQMSNSLSALGQSVSIVSGTLLEPNNVRNSSRTGKAEGGGAGRSKFDVLLGKIEPLMEVSSKMDEVWHVVVGTKSSVDDLGPKSDQLLHTSNRQERAIINIKNDLQTTTREIIANIGMVEKKLRRQEDERAASNAFRIISASDERANDFAEDQVEDQLTAAGSAFLGRTAETSKRFIRPATLPPRASTSEKTSVFAHWDKEVPFDLLDKEFLETYNETTDSTTQKPVLSARGRGRPRAVFPGRPTPSPVVTKESIFTFLDATPAAASNVGAYSCQDFRERGMNTSGIYYIRIHGTTYWYLKVFCDMETDGGGWTVIQRRDDYGEELQQSFSQPWEQYKQGFGEPDRDFWLGNENIFMLTNMENHQLRVEVEDFEREQRYAVYNKFKIHGETDNYKLEIDEYNGNAGDSMNDPWYGSNLSPFSTFDRDNDRSSLNCANMLKGGWWWRSCGRGLNGLYLTDPNDAIARQGIVWYRWRGWDYSLRRSVMMIRPLRERDTTTAPPSDNNDN